MYNDIEVINMSCFNKIKALATRKSIAIKDIADYFGMSYNSFNNKIRDCDTRFNFKDLINYADMLGLKIAVIDENEKVLEVFEKEDIKKDPHSN